MGKKHLFSLFWRKKSWISVALIYEIQSSKTEITRRRKYCLFCSHVCVLLCSSPLLIPMCRINALLFRFSFSPLNLGYSNIPSLQKYSVCACGSVALCASEFSRNWSGKWVLLGVYRLKHNRLLNKQRNYRQKFSWFEKILFHSKSEKTNSIRIFMSSVIWSSVSPSRRHC